MDYVDQILSKLADLVRQRKFVELETDTLEIKPVPADGHQWKQIHQSVNAFLNTRGGIVILGVKEEQNPRLYTASGWKEQAENNLREFAGKFTDRDGKPTDLTSCFPPKQIRELPGGLGRVCIIYVDELPADQKFVFLNGTGYKRHLTGDVKLGESEIATQEEFKQEAKNARELQPVPGLTEANLDLAKLNQFIFQLNQPTPVETMKSDILQARPFLERRCFIRGESITVLGALVCAAYPGECLGFRSHLHGYVDVSSPADASDPGRPVVQDKQDFVDNVLQLMEAGLGYLQRNIQVGVSPRDAGVNLPQYPTALLRETVNNALAHRDYAIDRQVILSIKPGKHIAIQNPGTFRPQLLIQAPNHTIPLYRILPEAKPRNPKLADVLRVFRKWEGRGIGMATLVNMCLDNQMDIPFYRLLSDEVRLHVCAGRLLDERMERLFQSFDGHIESSLGGGALTLEQKLVLSYLIKSEWHNQKLGYTILLTADNNHFGAIAGLERARLISKHSDGKIHYPVYVADRVLVSHDYAAELRGIFGAAFDGLQPILRQLLGIVFRFGKYSKAKTVSAKQASYVLWYDQGDSGSIEQFDAHYRRVRRTFNKLEEFGYVKKSALKPSGYILNEQYGGRSCEAKGA